MGSKGKIITESDKAIVIKWSGGMHWAGNFMPREYHSPRVHVLELTSKWETIKKSTGIVFKGTREVKAKLLIEWEVKRGEGNNV